MGTMTCRCGERLRAKAIKPGMQVTCFKCGLRSKVTAKPSRGLSCGPVAERHGEPTWMRLAPVPVLISTATLLELGSRHPRRMAAALVVAVGIITWLAMWPSERAATALSPAAATGGEQVPATAPPLVAHAENETKEEPQESESAPTAVEATDADHVADAQPGEAAAGVFVSTRNAAKELQRWIDVKPEASQVALAWHSVDEAFLDGQWTLEAGRRNHSTDGVVAGTADSRLVAYYESRAFRPYHLVKLVDVARRRRGVVALPERGATELQFSPCGRWLVLREMLNVGSVVISSDGVLVEPLASRVLRVVNTASLEQQALLTGPVKITAHITSRRSVVGAGLYRFTADGDRIAVAYKNIVRVWNLNAEPAQLEAELTAGDEITALDFDSSAKELVAQEKQLGSDRWQTGTWRHLGRVAGELETEAGRKAAAKRAWRSPLPSRFVRAVSPDGTRWVSLERIVADGRDANSLTFYDAHSDRFDILDMVPLPERWWEFGKFYFCGNSRLVAQSTFGQPIVLDLTNRTAYAIGPVEHAGSADEADGQQGSSSSRRRSAFPTNGGQLKQVSVVGDNLVWGLREDARVELWNVSAAVEHAKSKPTVDLKLQGEWREWTDDRGRKLTARLAGVRDGDVELHPKGQRNRFIPWIKLSQADQIHVKWAVYEGGELRAWQLADGSTLRASLVGVENRRARLKRDSGETLLVEIADGEWDYIRGIGERIGSRMARQVEKLPDNDAALLRQIGAEQEGMQGVWKVVSGLQEGHPEEDGLFYFLGNRMAKPFYAPHQDMQWNWRRLWFVPRRTTKAMLNYMDNTEVGAWIYARKGDRLRLEFCIPPGVNTEFSGRAMELVRVRNTVDLDAIGVPIDDPQEQRSQP